MPRILLIDDSASALQVMEMVLTEAGHEVVACIDARRAIQLMRSGSFDLVITDIYMPEADGLEVLIESRSVCPKVPVIAMSAVTGQRSMLATAKRLGAGQTILKPCSKGDLLDAVAAVLAPSRAPL